MLISASFNRQWERGASTSDTYAIRSGVKLSNLAFSTLRAPRCRRTGGDSTPRLFRGSTMAENVVNGAQQSGKGHVYTRGYFRLSCHYFYFSKLKLNFSVKTKNLVFCLRCCSTGSCPSNYTHAFVAVFTLPFPKRTLGYLNEFRSETASSSDSVWCPQNGCKTSCWRKQIDYEDKAQARYL